MEGLDMTGKKNQNENISVNEEAADDSAVSEQELDVSALKIKLAKPIQYEDALGKVTEYKEIDLTRLPEITAAQLCKIDHQIINRGYTGIRLELVREYAMLVACEINNMPYDWLDTMGARDSIRLREVVSLYFFVQA